MFIFNGFIFNGFTYIAAGVMTRPGGEERKGVKGIPLNFLPIDGGG
jgi:hypothetical protein